MSINDDRALDDDTLRRWIGWKVWMAQRDGQSTFDLSSIDWEEAFREGFRLGMEMGLRGEDS